MPGGRIPEEGELIRNPAHARSLQKLVQSGAGIGEAVSSAAHTREARIDAARREWSEGFVARAMAKAVQSPHRHSSGSDHRGVLTMADMAGFRASYEDAATLEFRGHTIAKTGPWGQGPALLQTLAILGGFDDDRLDPSTEIGAHTILEAQKLALADREAYYGDADVPLDYLLSAEYAASRRELITESASHDFRPGRVPGREPFMPALRTEYVPPALAGDDGGPLTGGGSLTDRGSGLSSGVVAGMAGVGEPTLGEPTPRYPTLGEPIFGEHTVEATGETRGDTCHIDVVDRWGNMVSATPSGGWWQHRRRRYRSWASASEPACR